MDIDQSTIFILIGIYFIISGVIQIIKGKSFDRYALDKGVVNAGHTVKFASLAIIVFGVLVMLPDLSEYGFYGLSLFLVISALSIHKFWECKDVSSRVSEGLHFGKNIGMAIMLYGMTL